MDKSMMILNRGHWNWLSQFWQTKLTKQDENWTGKRYPLDGIIPVLKSKHSLGTTPYGTTYRLNSLSESLTVNRGITETLKIDILVLREYINTLRVHGEILKRAVMVLAFLMLMLTCVLLFST